MAEGKLWVQPYLQWLRRQATLQVISKIAPARTHFRDHLERLIWPYLRFAICVPRDCPTIAEAFTEIPDCCPVTVLLAPGKYVEEGLVINKPVALRGNGKVQLSSKGPLSVNCEHHEGPGSPQLCNLDIESSIEIVTGAPVLKSCHLSGITVRGSAKPQIELCSFKAMGSTVLSLRDDAEVKLSDCSFQENTGTCIAARNSATVVVERGTFTQNGAPVLQLRDSATLRLSDSRLDSNNGCGILVRGDATAHISSSQLSGHKMSAVAFQHQATGSLSKSRLERNDGAVLLINGTAKGIMVEDNDFCNNGRSAPVIEFKASTGAVKAKIVAKREDETNGLTHKLAYISGQSGEEWADLDEGKSMIRNQSGNVDVPYKLKDPIRAGMAHDGEGGQMKGVSLTKGTKRCVIAIKDSACATVKRNRLKCNDGYGILISGDEMQDLDVIPLSRGQKVPGRRGEPPVTDVALRTPTKSFSQIKVLLKLRWLLRLHSACCELDYKMCSLRNIILGMQYVVLQECAEAECDSIFDTKVQQNVGAHLHLESVLDDIADQLYRSLGKAHRAFLEYVGSCDPMRSVHFSQIDSPLTPPQVQSNEQLAMAVDTIFVANFLRQSQRETPCSLQELFDDMEALNVQLPEIPPLNGAQNLRAWALAKTKPTPESRQKGLGEDMVKLAQLDAVLLCAAIELHSPEVTATESELQDRRVIVNVPDTSSQFGGAPEPINFGSTGRKPGVSPTNAKIMYMERPQLSPVIIDAVVHIIQHHFTFPEGIRTRLHRLLFEEYGLTTEQAQSVEIAATTNIDGKRLTEDVLWNIDQKEKARLRKYFVDTGKDTSHLLAPTLVPSPWMQGKLAKYAESKKVERPPFSSTFPKLSMSRSLPDFKAVQPFKVPLGTGPLTYSPELKQFRSTGFFMKMPPL